MPAERSRSRRIAINEFASEHASQPTAIEGSSGPNALPLNGLRVVDFGQYIAAPGAAAVLGELGAEVVKVEPPGGDQARSVGPSGEAMVRAYNAGKRSVTLDLRTPDGLAAARQLIAESDVLVANSRPGSLERLGLGYEDSVELNPRLIYARITGFGSEGPMASRPGLDIAAQAESGIMSINGRRDDDPTRVGFTVVDASAADVLAQSVLAALYSVTTTGRGVLVETSLMEVAVRMQAPMWEEYFASGEVPHRVGNGQAKMAPAAEVIATSDGHLVLSAYAQGHWKRLCELIGRSDLVTDPRFENNAARVAHRPELLEILREVFGHESSESLVERLNANGIVAGVVRDYAQAIQMAESHYPGLVRQDPVTGARQIGLPYRIGGQRISTFRPVPEPGHPAGV